MLKKTIGFLAYSREITVLNKEFPTKVWPTSFTSYLKFQIHFKIKPVCMSDFEFCRPSLGKSEA
jgi:hypothetical protein